ncbi:HNH endonuclease signature motif containing protein [Streptomyces sp. NPDC057271]|uniref:HNH endonuclease signature motif containing protein n=1 Tax=unclassified Streptomyces TaxID=2593676 RepID=UPI00363175A8
MPTPVRDPRGRLLEKAVPGQSGCLVWTAQLNHEGYGRFWLNGKQVQAHRASYELLVGPIPEGKQIDHLCSNRRCINPHHLEPVTPWENVMRGRTPAATNAAKIACLRGHLFTSANTYISPKGSRECRACRSNASTRSKQRKTLARAGG